MRFSTVAACLSLASSAFAQGDVGALLASQPSLSVLLNLVQVAGLNQTLSTTPNITIFAPTNDAFFKIPKNSALQHAIDAKDVAVITALLSNHVVQGYYPASSITDVPFFAQTLLKPNKTDPSTERTSINNGSYVGVVKNGNGVDVISGGLTVSNVTQADVALGNKTIIHIVDTPLAFGPDLLEFSSEAGFTDFNAAVTTADPPLVLGPGPDNTNNNLTDLTVFIPSNGAFENIASVLATVNKTVLTEVLEYHVIGGSVIFSPSLGNITAPSLLTGSNLTFTVTQNGSAWVNNARIVLPNIIFFGGVAHVIDSVLNPLVPFNRSQLQPSAPAASRVAFSGASSGSSLPFSSTAFQSATATPLSTPAVILTAPPVATSSSSRMSTGSAASSTSSGGAAVTHGISGPLKTAGAAVMLAGGLFAVGL